MSSLLRWVALLWGAAKGIAGFARGVPDPGPPTGWAEDSPDAEADPARRESGAPASAERLVIGLLLAAGLCFMAFAVLIAVQANTQLLGGTAGGGLVLAAVALVVSGNRVVPQETRIEERPVLVDAGEEKEARSDLASGIEGVSRRRAIAAAAGFAGTGLVAAAAVPVTALGPDTKQLSESPWRRAKALVDEHGVPIGADQLEVGSFLTAFPEYADVRKLASPVVVVRVEPGELRLPPERRGWAPEGLLAFSKICTHASCAVSLFRYPTYQERSSGPALVCPCHYSTFDVLRAAKVIFGPAGRPLPQLPLAIAADRTLKAAGPLSGSVGPAWFDTKRGEP